MTMLTHQLDRTLVIDASRETVFRFFTDPQRWAAWWGAGSTIDPRAGGHVMIRYPDGTEALGQVIEIAAPERLVFSYGYAKGTPIPASGSLVTIRLEAQGAATRLHLTHAFAEAGVRDAHVQGWRYQLSLFANLIANEVYARADTLADRWFAAWSDPERSRREAELRSIVSDDVRMRDRFSAIDGLPDLLEHVAAVHQFMPGLVMVRQGEVRQCQGMAVADWIARTTDGQERGSGTNVFQLGTDGRLASITGFWRATANSR